MKPLCIYHGNCADGFTSAWAVWKAHGEDFDYHPGIYGESPPNVEGRRVVMVDFSYKRDVLEKMGGAAESITILDHHKTALEDLEPFVCSGAMFASSCPSEEIAHRKAEGRLPIAALFDMNRSGAMMAWEYYHPGIAAPNLVQYVQDRDLWRFDLPQSREVSAFIFAHEYTFENWDYLNAMTKDHMTLQNVADMGGAIEKKHMKDVRELVAQSKRTMTIGGHEVPVANLPYTMSSDAAGMMAEGQPFAACYFDKADCRMWSLRSRDGGIDVSEVAGGYGGGGHAQAAGFQTPIGWEGD